MKLLDVKTGNAVDIDSDTVLIVQNGVNRGDGFPLTEIIEPCDKWPDGLLKSKSTGEGWQQYVPSVFGLRILK